MAVDYTEARLVDVDEGVYSTDYNKLALAFNDRLKNGVADPTWRLLWYAHSLVRGMRNPNGFTYAAEDEWWKVYAHIKEASNITWPTAAAGEPEGINVSNPLGAFIYGLEPSLESEEGRINGTGQFNPSGTTLSTAPTGVPLFLDDGGTLRAPASLADYWEIAKYQRGAVASDFSDYSASNAIRASQSHGEINYSNGHYFLKNYGGFLPTPPLNSTPLCDDGYTPNFDLKFTNLVGGSNKTYGTCPPTGVMFYFEGFSAYKIVKWNGSTESLPLTDYIEGPYEDDAYLSRYKGQQLNQALNWFAMEYRASESQREESDMNRYSDGFQFQDFMTRQYALAPAYGEVTTGSIAAVYPEFDIQGPQSAGTYLTVQNSGTYNGGNHYQVPAKFTFAGYYAKLYGAGAGDVEIEVMDGSTVIGGFTITAGGSPDKMLYYFPSAYHEAEIRFRLKSAMPSNVGINIECAMLMEYKPTIYDAYVCLRLGSTDGPSETSYDKSGYTFNSPVTISDNLLDFGCIIRGVAGIPTNTTEINENPVYESARRLIQNNLRMAERQSLVGYEVIGGKSYLHFKRYARGQYSGDLDVFDGIAPPDSNVASGDLIQGEQYQVWSTLGTGTVVYDGTTYNPITAAGESGGEMAGTFFTATENKDYTATGDCVVKVRNGIRSSPIRDNREDRFRGQTNEWVTQMTTAVYKLSDSSIYKPDSYADIMGFLTDRCGLLSYAWSRMSGNSWQHKNEVNAHVNYNSKMVLRPENPSGYRYVLNSHGPSSGTSQVNSMVQSQNTSSAGSGDINHYKSCQIYKPDLAVEAVYIDPNTYYTDTDYNVIVKLNGRLDNENAPSSISNTSTSWYTSFTGSYVPVRRTDENAVLEYLYHEASYASGSITDYNCIQRVGDIAYDANASSGYYGNDFHGNCYPRFYFSKLVRHVWNDENAQYDVEDSITTVDEMLYMEFVLQAMCSGFIDKESSVQLTCTGDARYYDYTFANLCYQALTLGRNDIAYVDVTRSTDTFTWDMGEDGLYTLVGVGSGDAETLIATSVQSPYTETGVPSYSSYRAYAGSNNKGERLAVDFTLTYSGANNDNVIAFTDDTANNIKYMLLGRAAPSSGTDGNSAAWAYWTGSAWSLSEDNAADVSSPVTIAGAYAKAEYRVEAIAYGRKRWFEFLPPTLRPDNAQGFGPLPNTNLYARIFNNFCNAVNLLTRARIDLPFNFQTREGVQTNLGTKTSGTGTTTSAVPDTNTYPYDYGCSEGTTIVAALDNFSLTVEHANASYGGSAITDRALKTAATSWGTSNCESQAMLHFGSFSAACGVSSKQGAVTSGDTFDDGGTDYYKFYYVSSKYNGEFRVTDENVKYALPTSIRDQFMDNPGFVGYELHHLTKDVIDNTNGTLPVDTNGVNFTGGVKYRHIDKELWFCTFYESDVKLDASESPLYGEFKTADLYYNQSGTNYFKSGGSDLRLTFYPFDDLPAFIKIPLVVRNYPEST